MLVKSLEPRHTIPMIAHLKVRCGCQLDPNAVCATHPCLCHECRQAKKRGDADAAHTCKWRELHTQYLANALPRVDVRDELEKLTYCETLELSGKKAPTSCRERNLLNIMSYHCQDSMQSSLMVLDKSQSISRTQMCPGVT